MRIFVAFEGVFESFDVSAEDTVQTLKLMIKDYFHVPLCEDKQGRKYLELIYAGAVLKNSWVLADVGVTTCSTLKCIVKEEDKPVLYVYNAATQETIPIMGNIHLVGKKVAYLKTLISQLSGFPVSVFCLRTPRGREMYDCNTLRDYQADVGTTLRLDVWDGWKEFLAGCLLGRKLEAQRYLSEEEPVLNYQKRVALYIAAFYGHVELTEWLLKQGARPDEAVGVHPYREWCHETHHPDVIKCPVHAAAEKGQLLILKTFVNRSVLCLECRNAEGQIPLALAIKNKRKDCVLYLVAKMWSVVSFSKISVPMRIYIRLKRWLLGAQSRILTWKRPSGSRVFRARVGDVVLVDGFTEPRMTSRGKQKAVSPVGLQASELPRILGQTQSRRVGKPWGASRRDPREETLRLPPVEKGPKMPELQRGQARSKKKKADFTNGIENMSFESVPLPPVSTTGYSQAPLYSASRNAALFLSSSLKSFSEHSGKTPRENAIYCLAVASAFKKKGWLQQLAIARILAKRSVSNPTAGRSLTINQNPLGPEL
ncbi:protein ANKUB1 [Ornithorhynchus anatinus]|uniref:Ankyrin repeat and ubiquitin domain containing 1 n=1 Tax=Ornithorhynchus anatinus TaxID=9258 RepID=K7EAE8_ORNAN|nr:protein ANKUB1 [Ornithorhynchus anatinus]